MWYNMNNTTNGLISKYDSSNDEKNSRNVTSNKNILNETVGGNSGVKRKEPGFNDKRRCYSQPYSEPICRTL